MVKQQNIIFENNLQFNVQNGGILKKDTEIVNLFFYDHGLSNSLKQVGNNFEWAPIIWLNFEKESLKKIKEINIISLLGDLSNFQPYCQQLFPEVKVNYFQHNLYLQIKPLEETLSNKEQTLNKHIVKKHMFYTSIGTMRLNRYILLKFGLQNNLNFYYPRVQIEESRDFEFQISRGTRKPLQQTLNLEANRMYNNDLDGYNFNKQHFKFIQESLLNFVVTFPNTDFLKYAHDEKYFDTILAKAIPFVLSHKNSNIDGIKTLGFLPYEGFNLAYDNHDNPVIRWQKLLEDNLSFFQNKEKAKELYYKNKKIIEYNFDRLINTDWRQERKIQYESLPKVIQEQVDSINVVN